MALFSLPPLGDHPVFSKPEARNRAELDKAFDIYRKWRAGGHIKGTAPLFVDIVNDEVRFYSIGKGGKRWETKGPTNPEGLRPVDWKDHIGRAQKSRARRKNATISKGDLYEVFRSQFPKDVPDDEIRRFAEAMYAMNAEDIAAIRRLRPPGYHTDHLVSIYDGGLEWRTNLANITAAENLKKGKKSISITEQLARGTSTDLTHTVMSGRYSRLTDDIGHDVRKVVGPASDVLTRKGIKPGTEMLVTQGGKTFMKKAGKWIPVVGVVFAGMGFLDNLSAFAADPTKHNWAQLGLSTTELAAETVSTAGILAAPFTGGASLAAVPAAEAISLAAGGAEIGTAIHEHQHNKNRAQIRSMVGVEEPEEELMTQSI
tara:strand:+ start:2132 stop:3247 length:1116 start_codon:yes stop_codon:yes gene_type:complete